MSKRLSASLLSLIILLSACAYIFFAEQKEGYHCDEVYSFGLSNSTFHYEMYDEDGKVRWNTAEDIASYMTVSEERRFDYANVYKNQEEDVHPPLFYLFLHTFASTAPGTASAYHAIITNIVFAAGSVVFLYLIALSVMKRRFLALLTALLYALSVNCINMVTYMRMYAMLTFFATASAYLHIRFWDRGFVITKKGALGIACVTLLGALTHYYFLVFLFLLVAISIIKMIRRGEKAKLFNYLVLMLLLSAIYVFLWPAVFGHLFFSKRGVQAFSNLVDGSFFMNVYFYLKVLINGTGILSFLSLMAGFAVWTVAFIKRRSKALSLFKRHKNILTLLLVCILYFAVILKIAPYQSDRYIAPVFPIISLFVVFSLHYVCRRLFSKFKNKDRGIAVFLLTFVLAGSFIGIYNSFYSTAAGEETNYLYPLSEKHENILSEHGGKKCVMINSHEAQFFWSLNDYENYAETAFVDVNEIHKLSENNHLENEDEFVLYINELEDPKQRIAEVTDAVGFENYSYSLLADFNMRNHANIYHVYKK